MSTILAMFQSKTFSIGVIGLGYVGLPLASEFAQVGIKVLGFDVNSKRVQDLNQGVSHIQDVPTKLVSELVHKSLFSATDDFGRLGEVDVIIICVPTPLSRSQDPDMSYIESAVTAIKKTLRKDQLIILESTTYPGTTEELVLPLLSETGLVVGKDFYLAFSPERVDPGNLQFQTRNTPKVVGGISENCLHLAKSVYAHAIDTIVPVSTPKCAELVKLFENTFRSVNIALANEMALICDKLGVDVWELIEAASTKPFGFMPFYPGPGLGGHCIPIDPSYLSWKLKSVDYDARFIALAREVNMQMPSYVVALISDALNSHQKSVNGASILIIGIAYKADINDMRESPALEIMGYLMDKGASLQFHDALNQKCVVRDNCFESVELTPPLLSSVDLVVLVTPHSDFPKAMVLDAAKLIVDTRNTFKGIRPDKIYSLGAS